MRCFTSLPSLRFARGHALLSAVAVFSVVLLASALYTLTRPKLYEAVASFDDVAPQDSKEFEHTLQSIQVTYDDCVRFAESTRMIQRVAARITGDDLERMLTPYASRGERNAALLDSVLISNRHIKTMPSTGSVSVAYRHPDPEIAAAVANMFIDELIQWTSRLRLDRKIRDVEMIQITKQTLAKQVEELSQQLSSLGNSPPEPHAEKIRNANYADTQEKLNSAKQSLADATQKQKEANWISQSELRSVRRTTTATPPLDYIAPSHRLHLVWGTLLASLSAAITHLFLKRRPAITTTNF